MLESRRSRKYEVSVILIIVSLSVGVGYTYYPKVGDPGRFQNIDKLITQSNLSVFYENKGQLFDSIDFYTLTDEGII